MRIHRKNTLATKSLIGVISCVVIAGAAYGSVILSRTIFAASKTFTVTTTADSGAGSLRQAIIDSNTNTTTAEAPNRIEFKIPNVDASNPQVKTIALATALPVMTQPVVIDGTTQSGASCGTLVPTDAKGVIQPNNTPHRLMVEVTAMNIPATSNTTVFNFGQTSNNSSLRGLVVNGSNNKSNYNIQVDSSKITIECNYIGTHADGAIFVTHNGHGGMYLSNKVVGAIIQNNLISGSGANGVDGAGGVVSYGSSVKIQKNIVGLDATGKTALPKATSNDVAQDGILVGGDDTVVYKNIVSSQSTAIGKAAYLATADGASVKGNYIGTDSSGAKIIENKGNGISLSGNNITIGGDDIDSRNIISGAGASSSGNGPNGISVMGNNNKTVGNYIGLAVDGVTALGKFFIGAGGYGNMWEISDNIIVGALRGISTFQRYNSTTGVFVCDNLTVKNNYIGVTKDGTVIPNGDGIWAGCNNQMIVNNVVSGNTTTGIYYGYEEFGSKVTMYGNIIGLKPDGVTPAPNNTGITISPEGPVQIGGSSDGQRNIISSNKSQGILIRNGKADASTTVVEGNYIGLDKNGVKALGNGNGVVVSDGHAQVKDNVISGNNGVGVIVNSTRPGGISVVVNNIGLSPDEKTKIPNAGNGVDVNNLNSNSGTVSIGGANDGEGNVVAGNGGHGIYVGNSTQPNGNLTIYGNSVGLNRAGNAMGNSFSGVAILKSSNVIVGGVKNGQANTIAYNTTPTNRDRSAQVYITDNASSGNTISGNKIYGVGNSLGIDLATTWTNGGVTPNDDKDADAGPNGLQNYPVTTYRLVNTCDNTTQEAPGKFNSTPNTTFTLDYYSNPSWTSGSPLQGEKWVGSETVTTDADGNASFTLPKDATNPTVTATAPDGSTSEFGGVSTAAFSDCADLSGDKQIVTVAKTQNPTSLRDIFKTNLLLSVTKKSSCSFSLDAPTEDSDVKLWIDGQEIAVSGLIANTTREQYDPVTRTCKITYTNPNGVQFESSKLASPLTVGVHSFKVQLTDPSSGLVTTHTFKDGLKVVEPSVNYNTTITNNTLPTLKALPDAGVTGVRVFAISPAGALNAGSVKSHIAVPTANMTDADGNKINTAWQVVSSAKDYADYNFSAEYGGGLGVSYRPGDPILANLQKACDENYQNTEISNYQITYNADGNVMNTQWTDTKTAQNCKDYLAYNYTYYVSAQNIEYYESIYDFSPLVDGKYDVYFRASYPASWQSFTETYPEGLIIDTTKPTADLTTKSASADDKVSPALTGTVSDVDATVRVRLNGKWYAATNNGDGTWSIAAGVVDALGSGTYDIEIEVTDVAGNSSTITKQIKVTVVSKLATGNGEAILSNTGLNAVLVAGAGLLAICAGGGLFLARRYKKMIANRLRL